MQHKIVIAITGASGSIYAKLLIEKLLKQKAQLAALELVMTDNAQTVWRTELDNEVYKDYDLPRYDVRDFMAPFASGSSRFDAMVICPCSMGMLGRIAHGISNDLISRAADVMLKERRKLICVLRDTPYNLIHIRNMQAVTEAGGIICPASPSFYSRPKDIEALALTVVDRIIDLIGMQQDTFRWGED